MGMIHHGMNKQQKPMHQEIVDDLDASITSTIVLWANVKISLNCLVEISSGRRINVRVGFRKVHHGSIMT